VGKGKDIKYSVFNSHMEEEGYHPDTNVSWSGTELFVQEFGEQETERQRVMFEVPTWQQKTLAQLGAVPPVVQQNPLLFLAGGVVIGVALAYLYSKAL
jgi:hypothetical protein